VYSLERNFSWEAAVLPLNYTRNRMRLSMVRHWPQIGIKAGDCRFGKDNCPGNFVGERRVQHNSLRVASAMAAGPSDKMWSLENLVDKPILLNGVV